MPLGSRVAWLDDTNARREVQTGVDHRHELRDGQSSNGASIAKIRRSLEGAGVTFDEDGRVRLQEGNEDVLA